MGKKKPHKPKRQSPGTGKGIPPILYPEIRRRYLFGESCAEIAGATKMAYETMRTYIRSKLEPELMQTGRRHVRIMRAEINQLRAYAWNALIAGESAVNLVEKQALKDDVLEIVEKIKQTAGHQHARTWTAVIQWCLEAEAKMGGYFKDGTNSDEAKSDFRAAGRSPDEIHRQMIEKISAEVARYRKEAKDAKQFS